ncbi:LysR family transcriptional regulator [Paeniglutamicibacter sp. NPDC091659]|uniref:LysR family transcriptional regulator n=1 Tax=Paeniglutamicibacter sp. NPDC091659 TaxID=3364389 RepID=UPI00381E532B
MEIRQLEYFLAVIEHNGVNRAAQHLHVAQATLSQGIKQLERELKLELFHRTGRNLVLNSAGRLLVEPARRILHELLSTKDIMRGALELSVGSITIGTMPEMSSEAVAAWSGSFTKQYPDIRIDMTEYADVDELCEEVLNGHCEIGFTTFPIPMENLQEIHFGVQRLMLVMPPGTDLPDIQPVQLSGLRELPLAVSNMAHRENDIVAETLKEHSIMGKIRANVPTRHAQLALVLNGSASAFLPIRMAVLAKKLGAVVVETTPTIRTPFGIVHRAGSLNPAAESFVLQSKAALNRWVGLIQQHQDAGEPLLNAALLADETLHGTI